MVGTLVLQHHLDGRRLHVLVPRFEGTGTDAHRCLFESATHHRFTRRVGIPWRGSDDLPGRGRGNDHRGRFPHARMRLVLFDIDGTLLNSGGMGRAAMQRALGLAFGSPGNPSYRYDGKTDRQTVRAVMRMEGPAAQHTDARMERVIALALPVP